MLKFAVPLLLAAAPAFAQSQVDGVAPVNTPHAEDSVRSMLLNLQERDQKEDDCWTYGCLIIVNETQSYDLIGFYTGRSKPGPGGKQRWGLNEFATGLRPMKAAIRPKTGGEGTCDMPIRFIMRQQETGKKVTLEGRASLCTSPHKDSLVRVKVAEGQVIWDDSVDEPTK